MQPGVVPAREGRPLDNPPAGAPFPPLTPEQQEYVNRVLTEWQARTDKIKTFRCQFVRWEYQPTDIPAEHPELQGKAGKQCEGELKYTAPDKGSFQVTKVLRLNLETGEYDVAKEANGKKEIGEHWVSTGEAIYEYDARPNQKVVIKRPIPPEMRGKAISNGPLPFLFGAEAEQLKRRYFLRIVTPAEFAEKEIWVDAYPRFRGDAANFQRSVLRLKRDSYEPFALKLFDPGHGSQTYEFRSVAINDKLEAIREFFAPPPVPFGWRLQVEDYSAAPQQQPAQPPATAGRPIGVR
jgi:TIGR03009 family protein